MTQYIDKDALEAKIDGEIKLLEPYLGACAGQIVMEANSKVAAYNQVKDILNTLEVKEVDLEEEIEKCLKKHSMLAVGKKDFTGIAKHFFELGMGIKNTIKAAERGTAEEIIINLKRVESDYRINLTKEIEWVRNQVKKGEEV